MPLNLKIKLLGTNKYTPWYGRSDGTVLDDLDKVASALGVNKDKCAEIITSIRVKKVIVRGGGAIDAIQFFYSVETKDKTIDVEGHKHGGTGGEENTWTFNDWYALRFYGYYGNYSGQTLIKFVEFKSIANSNYDVWTGNKGKPEGGDTGFEIITPACFYSRTIALWGGQLVGALGAYNGELTYDNQALLNNLPNTKDETLAWLQEIDRKDAERDLTKIPYQEITNQFVEKNARIQEIKANFPDIKNIKVINKLSEFTEEGNRYFLLYQLKDQNWVLLSRFGNFEFYIFTMFKDVESIENEIKPIFDSQLPKIYKWKGASSNKLLDRKPETSEESFIWSLSFLWGYCEYYEALSKGSEWNKFPFNENTQKYLIDKTRQQYWNLLPVEFKGEGRKKQIEDLTNEKNRLEKESAANYNDAKKYHGEKLAAEKERDALKTSVTDKEKIITQRDDYIKKQEAIITEKDATIAKLVQLVKETGDNDKLQALQVVASGNK